MVKTKLLKGKKKRWYPILAPKLFNNQMLGESLVADAESLVGKTMKINLMHLSKDPRKSNINLTFVVKDVKEGKGIADIAGYEMISATVKRLVKKGKNKINLSFECVTADGLLIRVKPLIITKNRTTGAILSSLSNHCAEDVKKYIAQVNFDDIIGQLLAHKLQMILKKQLTKVYPLRLFELRSVKFVDNKNLTNPLNKSRGINREIFGIAQT